MDLNSGNANFGTASYSGCGISTGTTFGASTEPLGGLTKNLFYASKKMVIKSFYDYQLLFWEFFFNPRTAPGQLKLECIWHS